MKPFNKDQTPPPLPHEGILSIAPYVGGESVSGHPSRRIRLAANESEYGAAPAAIAAFHNSAPSLHRYPDGSALQLRQALAAEFNLELERLICGTGSGDLINLVTRCYSGKGDEVIYTEHGFLMYPIATAANNATAIKVPEKNLTADVDGILAAVTPRTRIVFLANPNNPTGTYLAKNELARLHQELPSGILLVIDAAYCEFVGAADYDSGLELARGAENILVCRTFSKLYGLAALRLGWAYGSAATIDYMNRIRGPFNVGSAAQAAAIAALGEREFYATVVDRIQSERQRVTNALRQLGLTVPPSVANFILVGFAAVAKSKPNLTAAAANDWLKQNGILTRRVAAYGLPDYLRVTIGTTEDMDILIEELQSFLAGAA
ncbi:MAG: histidinol-phosphate transaminase [Candidatus Pacebacteria bacterium]|nr:histidinol-phosphate transaminase [Candidatus Paceibacterota bacterium]